MYLTSKKNASVIQSPILRVICSSKLNLICTVLVIIKIIGGKIKKKHY